MELYCESKKWLFCPTCTKQDNEWKDLSFLCGLNMFGLSLNWHLYITQPSMWNTFERDTLWRKTHENPESSVSELR